jgi:hypothetical protein
MKTNFGKISGLQRCGFGEVSEDRRHWVVASGSNNKLTS